MPRATYGAAARASEVERKKQAAWEKHLNRVANVVTTYMHKNGFRSAAALARAMGVKPDTLRGYLREGNWPYDVLFRVAEVLEMDNTARAALMGSREKCRVEL